MKWSVVWGCCVVACCAGLEAGAETPAQAFARLAVVPQPAQMDWLPTAFELSPESAVRYASGAAGAKEAAEFLAGCLRPVT